MKHFITLLLAVITTTASAQLYTSMGAGVSATKKTPAVELNVGYNLRTLLFQAGYVTHVNRRDPAIFNLRTGAEIVLSEGSSIYITGGAAWHLKSVDRPDQNLLSYIVGAEYVRFFSSQSAWTISIQHTAGYAFAIGGVRYYF